MYIGEVSKKTSLSIKAIRFYEEIELINAPARVGRYRVYTQVDVELLLLIKDAKALGITLSQLKGVIRYKNGKIDWLKIKLFLSEMRIQLTAQLDDIQNKIDSLDKCYEQISL